MAFATFLGSACNGGDTRLKVCQKLDTDPGPKDPACAGNTVCGYTGSVPGLNRNGGPADNDDEWFRADQQGNLMRDAQGNPIPVEKFCIVPKDNFRDCGGRDDSCPCAHNTQCASGSCILSRQPPTCD